MDLLNVIAKLKNRQPSILGSEKFRKSAILLPLLEIDNEIHILFEVRSMQMRSQPGDTCFPGGRIEPEDSGPLAGAIRETTEELGLPETAIQNIVPLDYIVSDSGRLIYPYAGILTQTDKLNPNPEEVGEVFTVPLEYLLQTEPEVYKVNLQVIPEDNFPLDLIVGGENYNWQTRHVNEIFYRYDGKVIWGLTAKVLTHFLDLVRG
ncbi:NUDIX hydrolase [Lentibacillus sediminis]|uniref:NUDIX hydrolase n=1 Tax=Lentibacillus sediminis TaxID=1940529 RepID=UPI000C1C1A17|nr:CoA pyrophosphatase [Lentibacillus sediminis]